MRCGKRQTQNRITCIIDRPSGPPNGAMDEMRAMLDELMGKERNLSLDERDKYK